jgi:hypothetical protein
MFVFAAFLVSSHVLTVADMVPAFDVKQTCRSTEIAALFPGQNLETCIETEEATRELLKQGWGEFSATNKAECISSVKTRAPPSYSELLTCLEMKRDGKSMRATSPEKPGPSGTNRLRHKPR